MSARSKRAAAGIVAQPSPYVFDPATRLWMRPGYQGIAYSDGDASEQSLLEILRSTQDLGTLSAELAGKITDWPTEAHLSAARSNLLRGFSFRPQQRVLEVGAGCGVLTRFLGECGAQVDALEGAPDRAACAAERCRDLDNVRVVCDEFTKFAADAKYDVVTLIGVLEYSRLFIRGSDPVAECLARARLLLRQGGALIVAIENQLGLKYFNGCREDHLGAPFAGITDLYTANSVVTFGRAELDARLKTAGFDGIDWYFPFPDYKIPSIIVSERAFSTSGFSVSDLLFGEGSRDYSGNPHRCFDEANVWPVLERNGLLADFSNSLLAVASSDNGDRLDAEPERIAYKVATSRQAHFATTTSFIRSGGQIVVRKALLDRDATKETDTAGLPIVHRLATESYVEGTLFAREFSKALGRGCDIVYLAGLLTPWIKLLLDRAEVTDDKTPAAAQWSNLRLPGDMLDCVPFNLIVDTDGHLRSIDMEFAVDGTIPMPWVVLRGLVHTAAKCFGHRAFFDLSAEELVRRMLPHFGLPDIDDWTPYLQLEDRLICAILRPWPRRADRDIFRSRLSLPVSTEISYLEGLARNSTDLEGANEALARLIAFLQHLEIVQADAERGEAPGAIGVLVDEAQMLSQTLARRASVVHDETRLGGTLTGLIKARWQLQVFSDELSASAKRFENSDRSGRALFSETEQRFHQREASLAKALFDAEARLETRESEITASAAAVAPRERALNEELAHATRQLELRSEEIAAARIKTAHLQRELQETSIRLERQLQRGGALIASATAAAEREKALHEALARSKGLEEQVWQLEERVRDQSRPVASVEHRLEAMEASRRYRLVKPSIRAGEFTGAGHHSLLRFKKTVFYLSRAAYKLMPISRGARVRLKDRFYGRYGRFFKHIQHFQVWEAQRATIFDPSTSSQVSEAGFAHSDPQPASDVAAKGISVVIPALGKVDMTRCCVEAVRRSGYSGPVEIIIVDDGTVTPIAPELADMVGVTIVRSATNQGFIAACNRGAASAREPYLMLLNNDTEVQPGALTEMVRTFESVPGAGAVGCKLVFPDGRLQEAGARIKEDGSSEMIGLWDDPNRSCYEFTREVGYCSAACLMIDRALFSSLGGLDSIFAPAYCEDSDLCYRIRQAGRKVIYQPRATVVHQLSASMADAGIDKRAVAEANQKRFFNRWQSTLRTEDAVRAIAFYLPQYHPIPENDEWWGKGFTDWTNVSKAQPVFPGHAQPVEPGELGYYDLRLSGPRKQQAELAKASGIHGFCYYYYWFDGKRLLHEPLDQMIASGEPDLPFCVCWANENWTRRWDGLDSEILIAQRHSPDDDLHFIESLMPALRDRRYIRVDGKPLLVVYRPALLPDARATAMRWRQYCLDHGVGDLYLAMVQSFYHLDSTGPNAFGFDAAIEFPPHSLAIAARNQPRGLNRQRFEGTLYDYPQTAETFLHREMPPYKLFRTVMPRWDNTPRRGRHANIFADATPTAFERWLKGAVDYTKRMYFGDERLVFINAWNEWGEGNFLEPDLLHGKAFLDVAQHVLSPRPER